MESCDAGRTQVGANAVASLLSPQLEGKEGGKVLEMPLSACARGCVWLVGEESCCF